MFGPQPRNEVRRLAAAGGAVQRAKQMEAAAGAAVEALESSASSRAAPRTALVELRARCALRRSASSARLRKLASLRSRHREGSYAWAGGVGGSDAVCGIARVAGALARALESSAASRDALRTALVELCEWFGFGIG